MSDSFGDSWNGNTFVISGQAFTLDTGYAGTEEVCVSPGCYDVEVDGGNW